MTSTYRQSNLPLWTGVNRPLTFLESDSNIYDKESRVTALEHTVAGLSSGAGIDYFSVSGNDFYVHLTNHEILGPYPLPVVVFKFRQDGSPPGTWLPSTLYTEMDVFQYGGILYVTNITHTSALTFDPHATDGAGHNLYSALFGQPQAAIPLGGTTGQALVKHSSTDLDIIWKSIALAGLSDVAITSLSTNQILHWNGTLWVNGGLSPPSPSVLGGVYSFAAVAHEFVTNVAFDGTCSLAQPAFTDISGIASPAQIRQTTVTNMGYGGTLSLNPALGDLFQISTITADTTVNAASTPSGARITVEIITGSPNSYNVTFGTGFRSQGILATGTTSGKVFTVSFIADGSSFNEISRTTAM